MYVVFRDITYILDYMMYTLKINRCILEWILIVAVLPTLIKADLPTDQCPSGCICRKRDVKCYALTDFPLSFPPMTTYIYMDEMNVQTIPPDSFHGLAALNVIEFRRSNFGSIPSCAFKEIPSLEKIIFDKSVIGHLENFAVFNISGLLSIEIKQSKITEMSSFAITSLPNMAKLHIRETTFFKIHPMAIVKVSGTELSVSDCIFKAVENKPFSFGQFVTIKFLKNKFDMLPCGTFDNLTPSVNNSFDGNGVQCDCGIKYVNGLQDGKQKDVLRTFYCLDENVINVNRTVIKALSEQLPCTPMNKEEITNCKPDKSVQVPTVKCPSHDHGGTYSPGNDHNPKGAGRTNLASRYLCLSVLLFFVLW